MPFLEESPSPSFPHSLGSSCLTHFRQPSIDREKIHYIDRGRCEPSILPRHFLSPDKVKISRIKYHNTRVIGIIRVTRVKNYRTVLTCLSTHKYTWESEVINARPGPLRLEPRYYQSQIGIRVTLHMGVSPHQSVTE